MAPRLLKRLDTAPPPDGWTPGTASNRKGATMKRRPLCPGLPGNLLSTAAALLLPSLALTGCLDRPIGLVEPNNTSTIVEVLTQSSVDKIDLLFAIDNSASMADKQAILAQAVPDLVERLVNPPCIDASGAPLPKDQQPKAPSDVCPNNTVREFDPVTDIHIGIVSSSLGGHGGNHCPDLTANALCGTGGKTESNNDHGHLLARSDACFGAPELPTYAGKRFLAWDPGRKLDPPGETQMGSLDGESTGLIPSLANMVKGVGQIGCGYESQLESIYRFLVDPAPYATITTDGKNIVADGRDDALLSERDEFLRPDSLVAIVVLTDENDCSIKEFGPYFRASDSPRLPRARAVCATDPNNACCTSCSAPTPAGCDPDPTCFDDQGNVATLSPTEDPASLRCFDQKRRFGVDFLYPTKRYVDGFSSDQVALRSGDLVENPLFAAKPGPNGKLLRRPKDFVFLAGIVGVPWQDIARDPSDLKKGLKTASEMEGDGTWDLLLTNRKTNTPALDPLMHESVEARDGTQPITGEPIDRTPETPNGNSINGHEWNTQGQDLQYACIFDLPTKTDCASDPSCSECESPDNDNPLCDETTRTLRARAKAYPGTRQLEVLQGLGDQGIVASVCPAQVADRSSADYGYRPAIGALVDRLKSKFHGQCLPRTLERDAKGNVKCLLVEARNSEGTCSCDPTHARTPIDPLHANVVAEVQKRAPEGSNFDCFCEVPQLEDEARDVCQNDISEAPVLASGAPVSGFCYVDATEDPSIGNPTLVANCPKSERRMIRVVGEGEPVLGATLYITCSAE